MVNNYDLENGWRETLIRYAPLILWIGVIAFLSSGFASMAETSRFIGPVLKYLFPTASEEILRSIHVVIRKIAHFTEYSLLAFLAVRAFASSSLKARGQLIYILPLALVVVVASADEINQSFEEARTGLASDALLDIASGALIIFLFWLFRKPRPYIAQDAPSSSLK